MADLLVFVPFAGDLLALDIAQLEVARQRARELLPSPSPSLLAPPGQEFLLTAEALAKLLGVPTSQVGTLAREGRIPSFLVGKYRRFRASAVFEALERDKSEAAPHTVAAARGLKNKPSARSVTIVQPDRRGAA